MLSLVFPKHVVLSNGLSAFVTSYHLWIFDNGTLIHVPGFAGGHRDSVTRFSIADSRIRFNENRARLKLNPLKFAYLLWGGVVYVAPKVVMMLNTHTFEKYIVVR